MRTFHYLNIQNNDDDIPLNNYNNNYLNFSKYSSCELFDFLIKHILLIRIFVPFPDIMILVFSLYFSLYPPYHFYSPIKKQDIFFAVFIFKCMSLIALTIVKIYLKKFMEENAINSKFTFDILTKLQLWGNNFMFCAYVVTLLNISLDSLMLIYTQCHGVDCKSVILNNSLEKIKNDVYLRKLLEIHIMISSLISNYINIIFIPMFIYFWNKLRNKNNFFNNLCVELDKFILKIESLFESILKMFVY